MWRAVQVFSFQESDIIVFPSMFGAFGFILATKKLACWGGSWHGDRGMFYFFSLSSLLRLVCSSVFTAAVDPTFPSDVKPHTRSMVLTSNFPLFWNTCLCFTLEKALDIVHLLLQVFLYLWVLLLMMRDFRFGCSFSLSLILLGNYLFIWRCFILMTYWLFKMLQKAFKLLQNPGTSPLICFFTHFLNVFIKFLSCC